MIPGSTPAQQRAAWQQEFADAVDDPVELLRLLDLPDQADRWSTEANRDFKLRVPHAFIRRMRKADPHDPLLRQVLPIPAERETRPGFCADPLEEHSAMPVPGLLHKYSGRALLTLTGACAINCRYCFRRHFPYPDAMPSHAHWPATLDYVRRHTELSEVILSGGDPLTVSDRRLAVIIAQLGELAHLKRVRIHTRLPVVIPNRVGDGLIAALTGSSLKPVIVVHVNHPNEIDAQFAAAVQRLSDAGIFLLNQSVLLNGVNDSVEILADLSERLFDVGILPYYLHQLDPVQGAAHFLVETAHAQQLSAQLRQRLPGYLVPLLVREVPGHPSKIPVDTASA